MEEKIEIIFHGFLSLPNLEKLKVVERINEYFDSMEREPIRAAHDEAFARIDLAAGGKVCPCCGR